MLEYLAGLMERILENHLEPQKKRLPKEMDQVWIAYRLDRLERRMGWFFRLIALSLIVDVVVWLVSCAS